MELKFFQITLACLCCCCIIASGQSPATLIEKGNQSYSLMKFNEAEKFYLDAQKLDRNKNYPQIYFNLGNISYRQKDYVSANKLYSQFITNSGDPVLESKAFYNIGNCYLEQKNYQQSISAFEKALKLNSKNDDARHNLSYVITLIGGSENKSSNQASNETDKKNSKQKTPPLKPLTPEEQRQLQKLLSQSELQAMKNETDNKSGGRKLIKDW